MIDPGILERIRNGERLRLSVTCTSVTELDKFRLWVQQFQRDCRACGMGYVATWNTLCKPNGNEEYITLGHMPQDWKMLFTGTLDRVCGPANSPFTIKEKTN